MDYIWFLVRAQTMGIHVHQRQHMPQISAWRLGAVQNTATTRPSAAVQAAPIYMPLRGRMDVNRTMALNRSSGRSHQYGPQAATKPLDNNNGSTAHGHPWPSMVTWATGINTDPGSSRSTEAWPMDQSAWPQVAAQSRTIHMAFGGNLGQGHQHASRLL